MGRKNRGKFRYDRCGKFARLVDFDVTNSCENSYQKCCDGVEVNSSTDKLSFFVVSLSIAMLFFFGGENFVH